MRVVIDPNVLVSGAIAAGRSAELIDLWLTERPFEIVTCPMLLAELRDVLARDKFRRWIDAVDARLYADRFEDESDTWPDPTDVPPATGDPKDNYLVALYRGSGADVLVSGDSDLTRLTEEDVTVLTPAQLLSRLGRETRS